MTHESHDARDRIDTPLGIEPDEAYMIKYVGNSSTDKGYSMEIIPPKTPYTETATINGREVSAGWSHHTNDYVLSIQRKGKQDGFMEPIRVSLQPTVAKVVFDYAVLLLKQKKYDDTELADIIEAMVKTLPYEPEFISHKSKSSKTDSNSNVGSPNDVSAILNNADK